MVYAHAAAALSAAAALRNRERSLLSAGENVPETSRKGIDHMKLRIREARERIGLSQRDLALKVGVAPNTFHGYESGKHDPRSELLVQIAEICGVTVDYLLGRDKAEKEVFDLRTLNFAKRFAALDEHGRKLLEVVAGEEERRLSEDREEAEPRHTRLIPLFAASFAAGPGEPDFGNMFEQYEVDEEARADFAIRVHGDSMEPWLHDGQIALGRHGKPADGDVAAVWVDGNYYVKQWIRDNYGNLYLHSLNRERADMDRVVWGSGDNDVRCIGVINLPERPPFPM